MAYEDTIRLKLELDATDIGSELSGIRSSIATAVSNIDLGAASASSGIGGGMVTGGNPAVDGQSLFWGLGMAARQFAGDVAGFGAHVGAIGGTIGTMGNAIGSNLFAGGISSVGAMGSPLIGPLSGAPIEVGIMDPAFYALNNLIGNTYHMSPNISNYQSGLIAEDPSLVGPMPWARIGMQSLQSGLGVSALGGAFSLGSRLAGGAGVSGFLGGVVGSSLLGGAAIWAMNEFVFDPAISRMGSGEMVRQMFPNLDLSEAYDVLGGTPGERIMQKLGRIGIGSASDPYKQILPEWMIQSMDTPYGNIEGRTAFMMEMANAGLLSRGASQGDLVNMMLTGAYIGTSLGVGVEDTLGVMGALSRGINTTNPALEYSLMTSGLMNGIGLIDPRSRAMLSATIGINQSLFANGVPLDALANNASIFGALNAQMSTEGSSLRAFASARGMSETAFANNFTQGTLAVGSTSLGSAAIALGAMREVAGVGGVSGALDSAMRGGIGDLGAAILRDPTIYMEGEIRAAEIKSGDLDALGNAADGILDIYGAFQPGLVDSKEKRARIIAFNLIRAGAPPQAARSAAEIYARRPAEEFFAGGVNAAAVALAPNPAGDKKFIDDFSLTHETYYDEMGLEMSRAVVRGDRRMKIAELALQDIDYSLQKDPFYETLKEMSMAKSEEELRAKFSDRSGLEREMKEFFSRMSRERRSYEGTGTSKEEREALDAAFNLRLSPVNKMYQMISNKSAWGSSDTAIGPQAEGFAPLFNQLSNTANKLAELYSQQIPPHQK